MNLALQRKIFVGCRQLGLDEDTRRDLQLVATGKESLSDMDDAEMRKVLDALKAKGFKPTSRAGKLKNHRQAAPRADLRYVHVLWGLLGRAGHLEKPDRAGLNAFVRSRFEGKWQSVPLDIDMLQNAGQINDVTRALKDWCRRKGIETEQQR